VIDCLGKIKNLEAYVQQRLIISYRRIGCACIRCQWPVHRHGAVHVRHDSPEPRSSAHGPTDQVNHLSSAFTDCSIPNTEPKPALVCQWTGPFFRREGLYLITDQTLLCE
jgi:hypothetical protein